jgi:Tfp pilus assembly ATPase PilU
MDYDSQIELYHMLTVLSEAVQKGMITAEIPQLMYDLYFSRKCLYAECHARSETPEENRYVITLFQARSWTY